jgi:Na+/H+-dicarboxylate symporter
MMYLDSFCSESDMHPFLYLFIDFIFRTMYFVWVVLSELCICVCTVSVFVLYRVCTI